MLPQLYDAVSFVDETLATDGEWTPAARGPQGVYGGDVPVDVVVLTVIPPELAAVRKAFRADKRRKAPDGTVSYLGQLRSRLAKRIYSIAVVCIGQPGNPAAAALATAAIKMFGPKALFLSGIGGGYRGKTRIGDAVFSERVVAYEPAAIGGGKRRTRLEPRPDTERPPHSMMQDLASWLADDKRDDRMKTRFSKLGQKPKAKKGKAAEYRAHVADPVNARAETIASGEKLVKNANAFLELQMLHGKVKVVEMEAAGLIEACRLGKVPWLVVRGVSDFGDALKDDRFHVYASTTAAVALADFIAEGLQLDPEVPQLSAKPYLARLRSELKRTASAAIPRIARTPSEQPAHLARTADGIVPGDGEVYFVSGPSGRGKTTALNLVASAALAASPVRVPVFVRVDGDAGLTELLRGAMQLASAVDEAAIMAWFERTPTLVIADDWHRASPAARERFEAVLRAMPRSRCGILVAGAESVGPPRVPGLRHLRLPRLTPDERDRLVDAAINMQIRGSVWLRGRLSPQLYELLREPVLLAKFLEMIRRTEFGATRPPHNLPELFERLLGALLSSVHADASRRAGEVTTVCGQLVRQGHPITLSRIAAALDACGVAREASLFAEELCAAAVWERSGAIYSFEHEIWRIYFLATAMQVENVWLAPGPLAAWVGAAPRPELAQLLPFATGMIEDPVLQRTLFDALMSRDLELYFQCLSTRAAVEALGSMHGADRTRYVLTELHAGYLGLVDRYVPALRSRLQPWIQGDGNEPARGEKPVVGGRLGNFDLRYSLGFGPAAGPDVIVEDRDWGGIDAPPSYAPRKGYSISSMRTGDDLRGDSARLVGARLLMKQLQELCEKGDLPPIGWIGRERFRSIVRELGSNGHLGEGFEHRSVAWIRDWTSHVLEQAGGAQIIINVNAAWNQAIEALELHELIEIGDRLAAEGLSEVSVWDLGLPGPDLPSQGGWFSNSYSDARKRQRVEGLYRAVTETYRAMYEHYFTALDRFAFYAQFPARAVVRILPDQPYAPTSLDVWWEAVPDWPSAIPEVSMGPQLDGRGFEQIANQMRANCERFQRPFITFTVSGGRAEWAPWEPAVTNEVRDMLSRDLQRIAGWLAGAS